MKSLRVLLIHRASDNYRRLTGWWSYMVPEFTWDVMRVPAENFTVDLKGKEADYDLVVLDDWIFGSITNRRIPLAYVTVDSARSKAQLYRNLEQAKRVSANLLLIDSDDLSKFTYAGGCPVARFAYCVNEKLFCPRTKSFDFAFLCWPTPARREVQRKVTEICQRRGWSFLTGTYPPEEYAERLASARVVVHKPHVEDARSWRVFDVMATRGCLLSKPIPYVSGDWTLAGKHYATYHSLDDLESSMEYSLANWEAHAQVGLELINESHTWRVRATQLRHLLQSTLNL